MLRGMMFVNLGLQLRPTRNLSAPLCRIPSYSRQKHTSILNKKCLQKRLRYPYSESVESFLSTIGQDGQKFANAGASYIWKIQENSSPFLIAEALFPQELKEFGLEKLDDDSANSVQNDKQSMAKSTTVHVRVSNDVKKEEEKHAIVAVGGPSALWAAYLCSEMWKNGHFFDDRPLCPPMFIQPPNYRNSAYYGSSKQFHVSHAMPMFIDSEFSATNLLYTTLKRLFLPSNDHPERDNYLIAEIKPQSLLDPNLITVGFGYFVNEVMYKIQSRLGLANIVDETVDLAIRSGQVMDRVGEALNQPLVIRKHTARIACNANETKEMQDLQLALTKHGANAYEISIDDSEELIGTTPRIDKKGSIWVTQGDGQMVPDVYSILTKAIKDNGCEVVEGLVKEVLVDTDRSARGVVIETLDGEKAIKTDNIYTSLGIKTSYKMSRELSRSGVIKRPERVASATGYSAMLIVEGHIKRPVDSNNSHFTPIATKTTLHGKVYTLVKTTCGGLIGGDTFAVNHAINSLFYATHVIFPGKKVDILAAKSCTRSLNRKNTGKYTELVPGFHVGTGFGGTGVTNAPGFAYDVVTKIFKNATTSGCLPAL